MRYFLQFRDTPKSNKRYMVDFFLENLFFHSSHNFENIRISISITISANSQVNFVGVFVFLESNSGTNNRIRRAHGDLIDNLNESVNERAHL